MLHVSNFMQKNYCQMHILNLEVQNYFRIVVTNNKVLQMVILQAFAV